MTDGPAIVIDTSAQGELRLALVRGDGPTRLDHKHSYPTDTLPTLTDGLLRFASDTGINLRDADAVLAVAGAVSDKSISIARSRWTVTREGLAVMFRRAPLIINEVAAQAWATRAGSFGADAVRGIGKPDLQHAGRHILVTVEEGVGCAIIDVDHAGTARVVESEAGHGDFIVGDPASAKLAAALPGGALGAAPSWEQVLLLGRSDPALVAALEGANDRDRQRLLGCLFGRFVVNVLQVAAAWSGVMLSGRRAQHLLAGEGRLGFETAFTQRRTMRRLVEKAPCWIVTQSDPVLVGAATMLVEHRRLHGTVPVPSPR